MTCIRAAQSGKISCRTEIELLNTTCNCTGHCNNVLITGATESPTNYPSFSPLVAPTTSPPLPTDEPTTLPTVAPTIYPSYNCLPTTKNYPTTSPPISQIASTTPVTTNLTSPPNIDTTSIATTKLPNRNRSYINKNVLVIVIIIIGIILLIAIIVLCFCCDDQAPAQEMEMNDIVQNSSSYALKRQGENQTNIRQISITRHEKVCIQHGNEVIVGIGEITYSREIGQHN